MHFRFLQPPTSLALLTPRFDQFNSNGAPNKSLLNISQFITPFSYPQASYGKGTDDGVGVLCWLGHLEILV